MSKRFYTGVGHRSRAVEPGVDKFITDLAVELDKRGLTLLSGDADGVDNYFERGSNDNCYIYLPTANFGYYPGRPPYNRHVLSKEEREFAENALSYYEILPEISSMSLYNKNYHLRNFFQSWNDGQIPEACFYYAKEDVKGIIDGGTRTAVYTARFLGVPCYNLYTQEQRDLVMNLLYAGEWD